MKKILIALALTVGANAHKMNENTPMKCVPYYAEFDKASKKKDDKKALSFYSKYIKCLNNKEVKK